MGWLEDVWETLTKPAHSDGRKGSAITANQQGTGPINRLSATRGGPTRTSGARNQFNRQTIGRTSEAPKRNVRSEPLSAFKARMPQQQAFTPSPNRVDRMNGSPVGTNQGMNIGAQAPQDDYGLGDILDGINAAMETPYGGIDPAIEAMLNGAFNAQFGAIDKARGTANSNYKESDARLEDLYAGHVFDINNHDANVYKQITQDWRGDIQGNYDSAINASQADRNAEAERQAAMMKNLGLQQSAPIANESADLLSEGIQGMQADKAGAMNTADTYGSADLSRNVARGQAVASQGAANRADLMGQLQSILGQLDNKRVETEQEKAMAFLEADQQSRDAWRDDRAVNVESLAALLEQQRADTQLSQENSWRNEDRNFEREMADRDAAMSMQELQMKNQGAAGGGSVFQQILSPYGENPAPWRNAYNDWTREGNFNAQSGEPLNVSLSKYFNRRPELDKSYIPEVAIALEKLGTKKYE